MLSGVSPPHPPPPESSASIWLICSLSPPRAPPPLVGPLESVAIPHPWLFPPSAPLWATVKAVARVQLSSSCSKPLLPPSSSHGLCLPAPSWVSVLLLSLLPNSHPFLPLLYLRCKNAPSRRGRNVRIGPVLSCVSVPVLPYLVLFLSLFSFIIISCTCISLITKCVLVPVCSFLPRRVIRCVCSGFHVGFSLVFHQ